VLYGRCPPESNIKMRQEDIARNILFFIFSKRKKERKKETLV